LEIQAAWRTFKEQCGDSIEDYSRLNESDDNVELKKAVMRLEEGKR